MRRRDFLRATGATAAAGASLALGCGDNLLAVTSAAVLEADATGAIVWLGGSAGADVEVTVTTLAGVAIAERRVRLGPAGTGWFELTGLLAATTYLVVPGGLGPLSFRTAPVSDAPATVRLAWSADCDLDPQFDSPMLATLAGLDVDCYVSLGDFPYADNAPGAITRAEYTTRHHALRDDPRVQAVLDRTSLRAIYDDHEVRNDWDLGSWAREPDRHVAALAAWDDFFPLRRADRTGPGVRYRRWRMGAHVEAFLLDTRRFRTDKAAADDGSKTMLGPVQRAWLVDGVRASPARFKLIFTTVPLDFGFTDEHWPAYRRERDALLADLSGLTGVLFLSADHHWFASHRHARGVREFQAGPLSRGLLTPPPAVAGVLVRIHEYNVGLLEVDAAGVMTVRCIGADGGERHREVLSADDLQVG
ncbi:MAG: alkaline phosphatase D family protein [Kofleriaceae bacterium]|nr:alkaline phosphatase D family protein [Kofleriaceae bacterium]